MQDRKVLSHCQVGLIEQHNARGKEAIHRLGVKRLGSPPPRHILYRAHGVAGDQQLFIRRNHVGLEG
jgi:hypothetical protein